MSNGAITAAAGKLRAPKPGKPLAAQLSAGGSGIIEGMQLRQQERREEALRNALLKVQQEQVDVSRGHLGVAERGATVAEADLALRETEGAARETERVRQQESLPALRSAVAQAAQRVGQPVEQEALDAADYDTLNELLDHFRGLHGQNIQLQVVQRTTEAEERRQLALELQRLESLRSAARARYSQVQREMDNMMATGALMDEARLLAQQSGQNPLTHVPQLREEKIQQVLKGEGFDLAAINAEYDQVMQSLRRMRTGWAPPVQVEQVSNRKFEEEAPEIQSEVETGFKAGLMQGNTYAPEQLDSMRLKGVPVDQWIGEVEEQQEIAAKQTLQSEGGGYPRPFPISLKSQSQPRAGPAQAGRLRGMGNWTTPDLPTPAAPPGDSAMSMQDRTLRDFSTRTSLRRRGSQ